MHNATPHYFLGVVVQPSRIHGNGVFAARHFGAGELIFEAVSEDVPLWALQAPSHNLAPNSIAYMGYIPDGGFVYVTELGSVVNHQTRGNVRIVPIELKWYVQALRPIQAGEELTADYAKLPPFLLQETEGFKEF